MKNLKDTLSTIFGIIGALGGVVLTIPNVPTWLGGVMIASSVAVIGVLTGKAPNGAIKTPEQVAEQSKK